MRTDIFPHTCADRGGSQKNSATLNLLFIVLRALNDVYSRLVHSFFQCQASNPELLGGAVCKWEYNPRLGGKISKSQASSTKI